MSSYREKNFCAGQSLARRVARRDMSNFVFKLIITANRFQRFTKLLC